MKKRFLVLFTIVFSLLFTSCLADVLNKKFGYSVPVVIHYSTSYGTIPKTRKLAAGQPLTTEDLPELSEAGYIFDGWYSDNNYSNKIQEGTVLSENTTLYARWIPRNDIPFTIYNYFLDPRFSTTGFVLKPEYTQHLTGTTNETITPGSYNLNTSSLYNSDLDKYQLIYLSGDPNFKYTTIKADGSSNINNYYYLYRIYDYEFRQIIPLLPDTSWCYMFDFRENGSLSSFNFYSIVNAIRDNLQITETYYDNSRNSERNRYNKHYSLVLTSLNISTIDYDIFRNLGAINQVSLPQTCTRISGGAFYGCDDLDYVYTDNTDSSKTWETYDTNGNRISLGSRPNPATLANFLRTSYQEVWLE